jgi:hypothetical protein
MLGCMMTAKHYSGAIIREHPPYDCEADCIRSLNWRLGSCGFRFRRPCGCRSAVLNTLKDRGSFAMLIKVYRASREGEQRYGSADAVKTEVVPVCGNPDPKPTSKGKT